MKPKDRPADGTMLGVMIGILWWNSPMHFYWFWIIFSIAFCLNLIYGRKV